MKSGPLLPSPAIPAPNGFHVYRPGITGPAVIIAEEKISRLCFVALTGSFFLNSQKIKESEFCFLPAGPGKQIRITQKNALKISPELLILNPAAEIFEEGKIPAPETPELLSIPALKSIAALLKQNSQSAAARWMNELLIRSFVYATGLADEKQKPKISHDQIKKIQNELQGVNTRGKTFSASTKIFQRLYRQAPKKLGHEIIMAAGLEELIHSATTLDQLARQSGYGSREFFITAFKKHFGITPATLRTHFRALSTPSPF